MYLPLQEGVHVNAVNIAGWAVGLVGLVATAVWTAYFFHPSTV